MITDEGTPALGRSEEYEAFGPWILRVASPADVPRVFAEFPFDFASCVVLKVPRDISRRDARAGMHLYDRMIAVGNGALTVLVRTGDFFETTSLVVDEIAVIELGTELVEGWFAATDTSGVRIEIPFNGSSRPMISAVIDRLGPAYAPVAEPARPEAGTLDGLDVALVGEYHAIAGRRGLQLLASQPATPPTLSGAILGASDRELVLIGRRHWVRHSTRPDLSIQETVIVRRHLTASSTGGSAIAGVTAVRLRAGKATVEALVPSDSPVVHALLAAL